MHGTPQGSTQDRTGAHGTAQRDTQDRTEKRSNAYRASFNKPSVLASRNGFWSGSCPCERCAMGTGLGIRLRGPCPSSSMQWVLVSGVAGACPGLSRRRSLQTGVAADLSRQFVSNKDPLVVPHLSVGMGVRSTLPFSEEKTYIQDQSRVFSKKTYTLHMYRCRAKQYWS